MDSLPLQGDQKGWGVSEFNEFLLGLTDLIDRLTMREMNPSFLRKFGSRKIRMRNVGFWFRSYPIGKVKIGFAGLADC